MEELVRWFDENGDEIIREPVNLDKVEPISEIGGELEESSIGVNFFSEHLDKDEITKLIGAKPTKAWNPNELHSMGNKGRSRITNWGKWYLCTKRDGRDINIKINELLNKLSSNLETWNELTSKYEVWIDVAGYIKNWNRGFKINTESMRKLSERNLDVYFDVYYEEQDNEETPHNKS